jgi:CelD/BcsL family acetyltransferase involved in cellulose biosynthesis
MAVGQLAGVDGACVIHPVTDSRWADLADDAPNATAFHHPLWLRLIRNSYRYPISAVCVADADGQLLAGLPIATVSSWLTGRRLVSVPFSDICGPIMIASKYEAPLIAAVNAERWRLGLTLEVHADVPLLAGGGPSDRFYHHVVPVVSDPDAVLRAHVKQTKRRGAARARRLGVCVSQRYDVGALEEFFRMHVLTRRRLGVPTQPRRLFRGLLPLLRRELAFVLRVHWQDRPIAAGIFLRHGSTLTYKYGASDPGHLDKRPNDLMLLEALRIALESGCSALDLGRTELDNPGLRRFKLDFGAEERTLTYTMSPPPSGRKSVRSVSPLQRTLIRHSPPLFGRMVGAAVYRHFG